MTLPIHSLCVSEKHFGDATVIIKEMQNILFLPYTFSLCVDDIWQPGDGDVMKNRELRISTKSAISCHKSGTL